MKPRQAYLPTLLANHVSEIRTRNRNKSVYPVYSVTNSDGFVASDGYFKKQVFSKDTSSYKVVPSGAFAYNPSRINVGSIDHLRQAMPVLVSPLYIVFQTSEKLYPPYLKRFLLSESGLAQIDHHTQGAVRDSLKFSGLQKIKIPLPSLDEQKRIAGVLDKADALRRLRQESLQLTEELLQSVFLDMFGSELNPTCPRVMLADHLNFLTSGGRGWAKYYSKTGDKFIRSTDVRMNEISDSEMVRVAAPQNAEAERTRVRVGDVLLTITGSLIGRVASVTAAHAGSYVSQHVAILRAHGFYPEFIAWAISTEEGQRQIQKNQTGQIKPGLNFDQIRRITIPRPTPELEEKFVRLVRKRLAVLADQRSSLVQAEDLFSSLQQRAFRGELDLSSLVLDPSDDIPAAIAPARSVFKLSKPKAAARFLPAPATLEPVLKKLDRTVSKGDTISWSVDYFKYRILATHPVPFSFADLMQKAEAVFEEPPPYETIRELIFDLLGQDGKPVLLRQRFDLQTNLDTSEVAGRKEILFELVP